MVFGDDLLENAYRLAALVDHIEIVLFYTSTLHNFPTFNEIMVLKKLGADEDLSFSVHLPAALEIACPQREKRKKSVQLAIDLIHIMDELNPMYHILHIPYTPPTLTPVPGLYFSGQHRDQFIDWTRRAVQSLEKIQSRTAQNDKLLIENINYSPIFLETFWNLGLCGLCLDMGHLMLGGESVTAVTKQFMPITSEVHLHGVIGCEEHLSLAVVPAKRVSKWLKLLLKSFYGGVINLEVFNQADLDASLRVLSDLIPINYEGRGT